MSVGDNSLVIEKTIANGACDEGYRTQCGLPFPTDILSWRASSNAIIAASGTTPFATAPNEGGNLIVAQWQFNANAAAFCTFVMPDEWADRQQDLLFTGYARKWDAAAADENATLKLSLTAEWWNPTAPPGTSSSQNALSGNLAAAVGDGGAFAAYTIDLGAALRAASKKIPRGAVVKLSFGPSAAVGTTDMVLQVTGINPMFRRHASLKTETLRKAK
jgi:hypothetical protein